MQITSPRATSSAGATYSERLTPSVWLLASIAVLAPMTAMVFVPFSETWALVIGALVGAAAIVLAVLASPRIRVRDGVLYAGHAHIAVALLGTPEYVTGEDARMLRGPGLNRWDWHLIRGVDGAVVMPVHDPDDPHSRWVISSRTPDRLAAAVRRAQLSAAREA